MKKLFAGIALALFAMGAMAQVKIATGDPKGTYSTMAKNINAVCSTRIPLLETNTKGTDENLALLAGNKLNAAIVQTDVLYFRSQTDDMSKIKTLVALHPEQVHVIVRNASLKTGGYLGGLVGAKSFTVSTVADLVGRKVGAVGGSVTTARVVSAQGGLNLQVIPFDKNDDALKALGAGDIDGVIVVGGQPMTVVSSLPNSFKVAGFTPALQSKLAGVYQPAKVSYQNVGAAGVPTVQTQALLVVRDYRSPDMVAKLDTLRKCILGNVVNISETDNTHPQWQNVSATDKGKWAFYEAK